MVEDVATTLSAPMEVSLDGNTRVFDNDLKWSWQSDDTIAALQLAGDMTVNTLTLKENGKFGTDEFKYATTDPSMFMFVYPAEAFDTTTFSYKFVQTGIWTPTLTGVVTDATIGSFSTVELTHQSAAFEIRVWEAGRETRKSIKAATITSTVDFLNGYGTTAAVSGLQSDTVVFNLAAGDYDFELTLTDANDAVYTVAVPTKNFKAGKRTILNVEWKAAVVEPTLSYTILSSYTNKDNSLDGHSIYVKDIVLTDADSATIELYLNGNKAADMTPGQTTTVSNLAIGQYSAVVKWSANGKEYTSEETKVYVTGVPCEASFVDNSYTDWSFTGGAAIASSNNRTVVKVTSNGSVISPEFGKNVSFEISVDLAGQSRNIDWNFIGSDKRSYGNVYMSAGTKSSTGGKTNVYILSTYSSSGSAQQDCMNYIGAVRGVTVSPSNPCLVCYREHSKYDGFIFKIKVNYAK